MLKKRSPLLLLIITALLAAILFTNSSPPMAQAAPTAGLDDFVITVKTDYRGTSTDTQFTIPTAPDIVYNYNVDCNNDGVDEITGATGDYTCTYAVAGTYTVRIKDNSGPVIGFPSGTRRGFPQILFNDNGDKLKLLTIEQWGTGRWRSMASAFAGCSNLAGQATDTPDLSSVSDMSSMFSGARAFNQDIGSWNTTNVTNMDRMFDSAHTFNQDIGSWNTANVTSMAKIFWDAYTFNQDIGSWNTANVTSMLYMFGKRSAFNQDIGSWNVESVTNFTGMLNHVVLSTANYDALLIGWNAQTLNSLQTFDVGRSNTYCAGEAARANMIAPVASGGDGWTINDGGESFDCRRTHFVITVKTDNTGASPTQFTIPTTGVGYNYSVDCDNDGINEASAQTGNYTCDYGTGNAGTYTIRIKRNGSAGTGFPRIYFNDDGDKLKLLTIEQWGTGQWDSMNRAFQGCSNLAGQATDAPDLSGVTEINQMFRDAAAFNQDISNWDTATVTNMAHMFRGAAAFNQDIGGWNTENVISMRNMFDGATAFNQDIGSWNVEAVSNFTEMFLGATLSIANYDALLIGWNAQDLSSNWGKPFDGGYSMYCDGTVARANMTDPSLGDNWIITDGGPGNCITWDGGGDSNDYNWSTAANWTGDMVPTDANVVRFDGTSTKDAIVDAAFSGAVAGIAINELYSGNISFERSLAVKHASRLNVGPYHQNGGTVIVNPLRSFTVDGVFRHTGGTLQETRPVGSSSTVNFLQIQTSGAVDVYRGADVDTNSSGNDLGSTTVSIEAVDLATAFCTTDGATSPAYAGRCFNITPTNNLAANVKLWALTNVMPTAVTDPSVYHYSGSSWQELANIATGMVDNYTWASGDTTGFSPFLLAQAGGGTGAPTAVSLQSISTSGGAALPPIAIATLLLALMGGIIMLRRRA